VGGTIFNPGGQAIKIFAWGLGIMKNNEVEVYALLKGINLALSKGIKKIIICGDYMLVIIALVSQKITEVISSLDF
jgi:ribonuclease HI